MTTEEEPMKLGILLNFNKFAWTVSFFAIRMAILLT
jgi:hypothetical protein